MGIIRGCFLLAYLMACCGQLWAQPQIEQIDASTYPTVTLWLQGELASIPASALTVYDGSEQAILQSWKAGQVDAPLKLALVIDRSQEMRQPGQSLDAPESRLDQLKAVGANLLEALRPQTDSAVLIHFGGSIDNTDLSDNFMVLSLILEGIEPYGDRVTRDAIAFGVGALRGNRGDKAILALVGGEDQASVVSLRSVQQMAQQTDIAVLVGYLGRMPSPDLLALTQSSGGALVASLNPQQLGARVDSMLAARRGRHQLVYQAPVEANGEVRLAISARLGDTLWVEGTYELPGDMAAASGRGRIPASDWPWWLYTIPVFLLLIGVATWLLSRILHQRRRATVISPTITSLAVDQRKGWLLVQFNLPQGRIPARISIYSYAGRPVSDQVIDSNRSRVKVSLRDLDEGVYHCHLSHAGQKSEEWEFVWERSG